ncbi:hypothetical protein QE363_002991 [Sphingomonas sp. SORGH_AS870]|uniref:hypothetical protein n=1 Tax=Sphingomonas sp. SORGH_AS_0870 TaxID=3041801 RepID=UPI002857652F|nr:hypothetical protein [Sphingomonas sp. SORGH_AS_0870]MDR6147198.1 hypothetical protein [Sphingomonas sp. SORGH_AS_0870]
MTNGEFSFAKSRCKLNGAKLVGGSFLTGRPSIIEAPFGIKPGDWDAKLDCVARLFGGDGVIKAPSNSFVFRFKN